MSTYVSQRQVANQRQLLSQRSAVPAKRGMSRGAKRLRAIVVLAILIAIGSQLYSWQSGQDRVAGQSAAANSESVSVQIRYVTVRAGETLWSLANRYAPNQDAQSWIDQVIQVNNLSSANLSVGQSLAIPNN